MVRSILKSAGLALSLLAAGSTFAGSTDPTGSVGGHILQLEVGCACATTWNDCVHAVIKVSGSGPTAIGVEYDFFEDGFLYQADMTLGLVAADGGLGSYFYRGCGPNGTPIAYLNINEHEKLTIGDTLLADGLRCKRVFSYGFEGYH